MQKIGLEAILDMSNFKSGMKDFTGGLDTMVSKSERAGGVIGKLGSVIGGLAKAGVGLAVAGIGALTGVIAASIGPAAEAQAVEAQLDAVLKSTGKAAAEQAAAWEAAQGKVVTSTRLSAAALGELGQELNDTQLDYNTLGSEIQEQKQRIWEMTNVWGEQGLNVQTAKDKLAEMTNEQNKLGSSMDVLRGKIEAGGQTITTALTKKLGLTAPVVQMTKDEILNLADALSQVTPYEDELIISTESILLQFQNIGKEVFPQATEMALDLAQRLGIDAVSAAKMLGKALVTPGEGLLRLKQAGVAFSDSQEKMIEKMVAAGDMAGAQKLIMDELALSVGGAARAAGETFSGQLEIAKNKIGNVQEAIGTAFLPVLTQLVGKFGDFVTQNGPQITAFFQKLADWIGVNLPIAVAMLSGFWTSTLLPALQTVGAWIQSALIPALANIYNWLAINLPPALAALAGFWNTTLYPALVAVGNFIVNSLVPAFVEIFNWLSVNIPPVIEALAGWLGVNVPKAIEAIGWAWDNVLYPVLKTLWTFIRDNILPVLGDIADWLGKTIPKAIDALGKAFTWIKDNILTPVAQAFDAIGEAIQWVIEKIQTVISWLEEIGDSLPDWLVPGSPTPFELGLLGIRDALRQVAAEGMPGLMMGISGAPAAGFTATRQLLQPAATSQPGTSSTTTIAGDTFYVRVQDRLAAAVLISAARDRQMRRLSIGAGG